MAMTICDVFSSVYSVGEGKNLIAIIVPAVVSIALLILIILIIIGEGC